jgi:hypothetical protein
MKTRPVGVCIFIVGCLLLVSGLAMAQPEQTTAGNPPLEQPLIREGDLAVKLVEALKLGTPESETEAESILASVDIIPGNGWIADYPVTPDIVEELQSAVGEAAESGKIAMNKEAAQKTVQDVVNDFDLFVKADTSGRAADETAVPDYADSTAENSYYYDEGPPVVTYYAPPPDYAYLYTWVPDPFWWSDVWFPGFFILVDFDVDVDRHRHRHRHDHDRDHGKHISNHFADPKTGRIFRVDPTSRYHGGTVSDRSGAVGSRPSAQSGARAIINTSRGRAATGAYREFRGYGASGPPSGARSSAFESSPNSQFERNSSERGFQSRSNAGLTPGSGRGSAGVSRGGGGTGSHGEGGAGFHGGGGGGGIRR